MSYQPEFKMLKKGPHASTTGKFPENAGLRTDSWGSNHFIHFYNGTFLAMYKQTNKQKTGKVIQYNFIFNFETIINNRIYIVRPIQLII